MTTSSTGTFSFVPTVLVLTRRIASTTFIDGSPTTLPKTAQPQPFVPLFVLISTCGLLAPSSPQPARKGSNKASRRRNRTDISDVLDRESILPPAAAIAFARQAKLLLEDARPQPAAGVGRRDVAGL